MTPDGRQDNAGDWLRNIILVVASLELMSAVTYLPYLMTRFAEMPKYGLIGLYLWFRILVVPALAAAAFLLAYKRVRLKLAALLAALPPLLFLLGILLVLVYFRY